jgi:hypothetical protein
MGIVGGSCVALCSDCYSDCTIPIWWKAHRPDKIEPLNPKEDARMPECSCIELLERIVSQGGMLSEHDLNDAWAILKANGSELTRDPEDDWNPSMNGPE